MNLETWNCCGQLHSAGAKCRICGKRKGGDNPAGIEDTELEPAFKNALERAIRDAFARFPSDAKLRVTFTRGFNRTPLDYDNLVGAFKSIRDAAAKTLGRDDAERHGIDWQYRQEKGDIRMVEIEEVK